MEHITWLGLDLTVGSAEELADTVEPGSIYVCARVVDMAATSSLLPTALRQSWLRTPCEQCREVVYYNPHGYVVGTRIVCTVCAAAQFAQLPDDQRKQLQVHTRFDPRTMFGGRR